MDEPRASVDPIIEEPGSSPQAFAKMTRPVLTCDVLGAKQSKRPEDQTSELVENLHEEGYPHDKTSQDGSTKVKEQEVLNDPYEIDVETLNADLCISNHSVDSCVTITEEDSASGGHVEPGPSHPVDRVDSLYGLPRASSGCGLSQVEEDDDLEKNLEVKVKEPVESSKLLLQEDNHEQEECPICTELYDTTKHKQSFLNCNHVFCDNCIRTMVNTANRTNLCRVTCPICRQTTPMLEWEVHKMQEQMMESGGVCIEPDYVPSQALVRRPGLCGALEYRFHKRFRSGRVFLFPPCLQNPQRLMTRLTRLEHRCRCLYLLALMFLLFAEFFCFLFLFLPILVFILMILLGK